MSQNILKIEDRGVSIELVLTNEAVVQVNGSLVFGQPKQGTMLDAPRMQLIKRESHEKTGIGTKAYQDAQKYLTEFESKFDKEFLTRFWNVVMDNLHFRNIVYRADYCKMLPQDKPVDAIAQSTKKFLMSGFCEQHQENISAIRNMFSAYITNCDRYYSAETATQTKTIIAKQKPKLTATDWASRAKEVLEQK